jgi:hypothetical protein
MATHTLGGVALPICHLKRFADQGDNELSAEVLAGQGTGAGPRVSLLRKSL